MILHLSKYEWRDKEEKGKWERWYLSIASKFLYLTLVAPSLSSQWKFVMCNIMGSFQNVVLKIIMSGAVWYYTCQNMSEWAVREAGKWDKWSLSIVSENNSCVLLSCPLPCLSNENLPCILFWIVFKS